MDTIELAAVPDSTPLVAALLMLRARGQSGLVSVGGDADLRLITPRDVVVALHDGRETLANIEGARRVTADLVPLEPAEIGRSKNWIVSALLLIAPLLAAERAALCAMKRGIAGVSRWSYPV